MISLKDYTVLYSDYFNNHNHNQNPVKPQTPFNYLYPSEIQPLNQSSFTNEKQELFTVSQLNSLQQCEALIEIIRSPYEQILSPSQQFCIIQHKNPNAQKRFLVIASDIHQSTLKKIAQNHFFENINVPSEQFCTYFIERILQFHHWLEGKGLHLKVITPSHIVVCQDQIFLNYPFPHDIFDTHGRGFFQQIQQQRCFCAPQILKVFNVSAKIDQNQADNTLIMMQSSDPIIYSGNYEGKDFKKAILYSLGLTIFYCFGLHIPLQDRIKCLKNPNQLNNFMNELRREIKIHHDGKYIAKLLKLMLEHSESLRDTISTFTYKMNSAQFSLLKRVAPKNTQISINQENVKTESEVNSQPFLNTTSAKKTIDIRISSMSNASSAINQSWLSVSQQNVDGKLTSPSELNKSLHEDKQKDRSVRSKRSAIANELNEIKEIEEIKQPSSPIELDVEWDQDSSMRGSSKSSKDKSKSSSDKDRKQKRPQLLNKISEKQEGEDEFQIKESKNKEIEEFSNEDELKVQKKLSPQKITLKNEIIMEGMQTNISKSQMGSKTNQLFNTSNSVLQIDKRISGSQNKLSSKHSKTEQQIEQTVEQQNDNGIESKSIPAVGKINFESFLSNVQEKKQEEKQTFENFRQQLQIRITAPLKTIPEKIKKLRSESAFVEESSTMSLYGKQGVASKPLESELNQSIANQAQDHEDEQNQSIIFEEPFFNDQELRMQQKLIKEKKVREKQKLTERKKDQYNERSRAILLTLIIICGVFKLVEYLMENSQQNGQ